MAILLLLALLSIVESRSVSHGIVNVDGGHVVLGYGLTWHFGCEADAPIRWTFQREGGDEHDVKISTNTTRVDFITFANATQDMSGVYRCYDANQHLMLVRPLTVLESGETRANVKYCTLGQPVTMKCEGGDGIYWKFNKTIIATDRPELNIAKYTKDNAGEYTCHIEPNNLIKYFTLDVATFSRWDVTGPVSVPCNALATKWTYAKTCADTELEIYKNGFVPYEFRQYAELTGRLLKMEWLDPSASGVYSCYGSQGNLINRAYLNIIRPSAKVKPLEPSVRRLMYGSRILLSCDQSNVLWKYVDIKNNVNYIQPSSNYELLNNKDLVASNVQEGIYSCIERNGYGSILNSYHVLLHSRPIVAIAGNTITLQCDSYGHNVVWKHRDNYEPHDFTVYTEGQIVSGFSNQYSIANNSLVIRDLTPYNAGNYRCMDDDGLGGSLKEYVLFVDLPTAAAPTETPTLPTVKSTNSKLTGIQDSQSDWLMVIFVILAVVLAIIVAIFIVMLKWCIV